MRQLFLWHRWLGIGLCIFMALWFISGMVMLFVGYPKLTPAEHLQSLPVLSSETNYISLDTALKQTGKTELPSDIKLSSIANQPVYLFHYPEQAVIAINAITGIAVNDIDAEQAMQSAKSMYPHANADYQGLIDKDAWTQSSALNVERPLHVVRLDDKDQTQLYISSHSGMIVRDATFTERSWGWLGAWLHWIYPVRSMPWWADMIIYLSLAATIMTILGQYIGLKRWRFSKTYKSGSHSPYRTGFARWHHIGGMVFGVVLILWIFSGLMSMRPWNLFNNASQLPLEHYSGEKTSLQSSSWSTAELLQRFEAKQFQPRELSWHQVNAQIWVNAQNQHGDRLVTPLLNSDRVYKQVPFITLKQAIQTISNTADNELIWLTHYDFYYYNRAEQSMYGDRERPLPILRVKFNDDAQTWLHINPATGEILESIDSQRRIARYLFNLLHSWDWQPLLERPLLRETFIVLFSLGGLLICVSGIVVGWRRIKRHIKVTA